jgi:hypothetical protein
MLSNGKSPHYAFERYAAVRPVGIYNLQVFGLIAPFFHIFPIPK